MALRKTKSIFAIIVGLGMISAYGQLTNWGQLFIISRYIVIILDISNYLSKNLSVRVWLA